MARRHRPEPHGLKGPSQRQLRVGEVVRHVLADVFARGDLQDPALQDTRITVSEVKVSPDMRHASVYVMRLGGGDMGEVIKGLGRARGYLRQEVGRALTTKFTPDLHFVEDKSFDTAQHVLEILKSEGVRGDLSQTDEDGDNQDDSKEGEDGAA